MYQINSNMLCLVTSGFNAHTSYINSSMITTFSWNKLELKDFLKNEIPPLFHIKYSLKYKSIDNIYNYLINQNIIYDGYDVNE